MHRTIPLLLALTACAEPGATPEEGGQLSLCPVYSGLQRVGAERAYQSTPEYESTFLATRAWVSTVVSAGEVEEGLEVVVESVNDELLQDGTERHDTTTNTYRCDAEGLWLVHHRFEWDGGWFVNDYTAPVHELPADLVVGQEWASSWSYESESDQGTGDPVDGQRVYRAMAEAEVHAAAGTFDTLRVELEGEGYVIPSYRDAEVGLVLTEQWFELEYFVQ